MVSFSIFLVGSIIIAVLFIVQEMFNKPIYNKYSNVYEEDEYGKTISRFIIIMMILIAFLLGIFMQ
jgi:uncharacterized membrane protein